MSQFFVVIQRIAAFFAAILATFMNLSVGNNIIISKDADVQLSVALVADTHVGQEFYRQLTFPAGVKDISRHVKPDVFLCAGDCTDNGNDANWQAFKEPIDKYLTVKERIIALGNHDTWTSYDGEREYDDAKRNFLTYANEIMDTDFDTVWFTREIGGYSFIVMGSEDDSVGATISNAQLNWVERELAEAAAKADGKPIFVINHQPLNFTHTIGENEDGNGFSSNAASDRLLRIMDQYENVFYISGHVHYGLKADPEGEPEGYTTVEKVGEHVTSVNLPCYAYGTFFTGGEDVVGQGLVMYVFKDRVEFKGRNLFLSNWITAFDVTVPLT